VLPVVPPLLRSDLHGGAGQGAVRPLREGLQRLDGRGVVRRFERPTHPAHHRAALGRRVGRRRDPPQRRSRRARRVLQRDPSVPRLPSIHTDYWEPFFRACAETGTVINMHIGSSSKMPSTSADAPAAVGSTLTFGNAMSSMTDWLFSGWLARLPELKIAYSEGQIGWIPYILERADKVWEDNRAWGGVSDAVAERPRPTTTARSTAASSTTSTASTTSRSAASTTSASRPTTRTPTARGPKSRETAEKLMGHLPADVIHKLVRGNAIEMLGLDLDG